jgi:hypothetical protein
MGTQIIVIMCSLAAFALLGFFLFREIKKLDAKKGKSSKKKGRTKYMPQVRNPK